MDYFKIYTEQYRNNYSIEQNLIKDELILYREKSKDYTFVHNAICKKLDKKIKSNTIPINNSLNDLFHHFKKSMSEYSENRMPFALENETLEKYNTLDKKDIPTDYSFELFIKDLADFMSVEEIRRVLSNNFRLCDLIYKSKDFTKFEIEEYDSVLENTEIYKYYSNLVYPQNNDIEVIYQKENPPKTVVKNDKTKTNNDIIYKLNEFEIDEKYLILHALYKVIEEKRCDSKKLVLAEFLRLIVICQGIDDTTIFEKNYTNKFYKSVSEGIEYSSNIDHKRNLKERVLKKLRELQVSEIENYVKDLKT